MADQSPHDEEDLARLGLLYQENARLASAFWEWQHKTITLFTGGIAALLAIEAWIYDRDFGRYNAAPFIAASVLSLMCLLFAARNRQILNQTNQLGQELETRIAARLGIQASLPYTYLSCSTPVYRRYLVPLFFIAAIVFAGLAIAAVVHPPAK